MRQVSDIQKDVIYRYQAIDEVQRIGRLATLEDNDAVIRMSAVEYILFNLPSAQFATDTNVGDKISRQALCEYALNQKDKSVTPNDIMRFPSAQPHWTPCSERLPEKNGDYLITGRQGAVNKRKYEDGRWYGNWAVIAWMPLPEPYGGEIDG